MITIVHHTLKSNYRQEDEELMMQKLVEDRNKIPSLNRKVRTNLTAKAHAPLNIDVDSAFKQLWLTNALDGSEEFLVSDRIMSLVGTKMREIRTKPLSKPVPKTLQELEKAIIPPKGMKRNVNIEGSELLDGSSDDEDVDQHK